MLLSEIELKQAELDDANRELNNLLDVPKSALEELLNFKARILKHGISRVDAVWFNKSYVSSKVCPIDLDTVNDTPTQVGLSAVLEKIEVSIQCLKNPN